MPIPNNRAYTRCTRTGFWQGCHDANGPDPLRGGEGPEPVGRGEERRNVYWDPNLPSMFTSLDWTLPTSGSKEWVTGRMKDWTP